MKLSLCSLLLCLSFFTQAQTPDSSLVRTEIDSLIELSDGLQKEKKLDEALSLLEQAHEKCLEHYGEETLLHARICSMLGLVYYRKKDLTEVESLANKSIAFFRTNEDQIIDPGYDVCFSLLMQVYVTQGLFEKAEKLEIENIEMKRRVFGKLSEEYAKSLSKIANYYFHIGSIKQAEPYLLESLAVYEKVLGNNNPEYASPLITLAHIKSDFGEYSEAEALYIEAQNIFESNKELNEHPYYMNCLDGLGTLYYNLGQYEKVGEIDTKNLYLKEKLYGKLHPAYARTLNNLAILYKDLEQYDKAVVFLLECKEIEEELLGTNNPSYAGTLINLGNVYKNNGETDKALKNFLEAMEIFKSNKELQKHEFYMSCLTGLGNIYTVIGENDKAEAFYLMDIEVRKKVLGTNHYTYSTSLDNLGILYKDLKEYDKAEPLFKEANDIRKTVLLKASKHLSEEELLNLIKLFNKNQNAMLSFAYLSDKLEGHVFDNSLFYKGYLLNSTLRINQLAKTNTISNNLYQELKKTHADLSDLYAVPVGSRDTISIASLEEKANQTEKELTRTITGFSEASKQVYWQGVQKTLGADEVAIEFEHFSIFNQDGPDTVIYAALLLLPESEPILIPLFKEEEITSVLSLHAERRSDYVNDLYSIEGRGATILGNRKKTLYELIWEPLEPLLKETKTIYFSPSGLLHRINIPAIPLDDELSLCDQYGFIQVNSTRQLVSANAVKTASNNALLMGGIEYDLESLPNLDLSNDSLAMASIASRGEFDFSSSNDSLRGGSWKYLKYTAKEVNKIDQMLSANNYTSEIVSGTYATEEFIQKNGQGKNAPRFLHLATHGFFFPDSYEKDNESSAFETSDHPLIRSGLILAGGNYVWQGNDPLPGKEDGILTAYEISQMDLSNTELVVLSACETGLGDIEGNEGVYGLQRAFKIAGAKYLIMSLWQIPDRETKDFMVRFYEHFLEDKMSIPDAFRLTQKEMKERFYNPYQWAGFVLVE